MGLPFESTDSMRCILLIKKIKTKENFTGLFFITLEFQDSNLFLL